MNKDDYDECVNKVYDNSEYIITSGLRGITHERAFEPNKINYIIDKDSLRYRIEWITKSIISLVIPIITDKIKKEIEEEIRNEIRNKI